MKIDDAVALARATNRILTVDPKDPAIFLLSTPLTLIHKSSGMEVLVDKMNKVKHTFHVMKHELWSSVNEYRAVDPTDFGPRDAA
ncbi:hypothetical protein H0W91_03995 [Patescibacteria group bacterium]|nr:hypothetical protein [Patescibacteria group bacterium]